MRVIKGVFTTFLPQSHAVIVSAVGGTALLNRVRGKHSFRDIKDHGETRQPVMWSGQARRRQWWLSSVTQLEKVNIFRI